MASLKRTHKLIPGKDNSEGEKYIFALSFYLLKNLPYRPGLLDYVEPNWKKSAKREEY